MISEVADRELLREALVDLHRAQQRELRFRKHSEALVRALRALSLLDEELGMGALLGVLGEELGAREAVLLVDERGQLKVMAAADPQGHASWPCQGPFLRAVRGARVNIADTTMVPEISAHPFVRDGRIRSLLLAGVPTGHAPGMLLLAHPQERAFGQDEVEVLIKLVPVAAAAILRLRARERERALLRQTQEQNTRLQREIGERRLAERRLREAQAGLIQAEKLSSLGRMISGIAHELRNPANYIANNVTTVQKRAERVWRGLLDMMDPTDAEGEAIAAWMEEEFGVLMAAAEHSAEGVQRIRAIVDSLGNFARIDDVHAKPVRLDVVVADALRILRAKWRTTRIDVHHEGDCVVQGQPVKLTQVVMNLLDNACFSATQANGESGAVVDVRITVGTHVELAVADNGPGVPADLVNRVFDPFVTTKPVGAGTGMGLSISWSIAAEHGGSIRYEPGSDAGGAKFVLVLPVPKLPQDISTVEGET